MKRTLSIVLTLIMGIGIFPQFAAAAVTADAVPAKAASSPLGAAVANTNAAILDSAMAYAEASLMSTDPLLGDDSMHTWSEWTELDRDMGAGTITESRTCLECGESEIRVRELTAEDLASPGTGPQSFADVLTEDYFYDSVIWAMSSGITNGTSGTEFSPNNICTRAQAVTFLWRAAGMERVQGAANPFRDVAEGSFYYDAVQWACSRNITNGTTRTTFEPDAYCTRAQIVTFLWRSLGEPKPQTTWSFEDVPSSAFYCIPVRWAVESNITMGTAGYAFSPEDPCTRGQIVTFLYRKNFSTGLVLMNGQEFMDAVASYVQKYAGQYGINVYSPVIAQAILESGWGKSRLAAQFHNYFGLKCGSKWTGSSVTMKTREEYTQGVITSVYANFRAYPSMEEGIKGYFEFIQSARYQNLKGITDPRQYMETIRADGYATSYTYVEQCMNLIEKYDLTKYDPY